MKTVKALKRGMAGMSEEKQEEKDRERTRESADGPGSERGDAVNEGEGTMEGEKIDKLTRK